MNWRFAALFAETLSLPLSAFVTAADPNAALLVWWAYWWF